MEGLKQPNFSVKKTNLSAKLSEEVETIEVKETGLTEIIVKFGSKEVKVLIDMGSEVSVISETH